MLFSATLYLLGRYPKKEGKMEKLEQIAKDQAKTLIKTLNLLDAEGFGDSDLNELKSQINVWIDHISPLKVGN